MRPMATRLTDQSSDWRNGWGVRPIGGFLCAMLAAGVCGVLMGIAVWGMMI